MFADDLLNGTIVTQAQEREAEQFNPIRPFATGPEMIAACDALVAKRDTPEYSREAEIALKDKMKLYGFHQRKIADADYRLLDTMSTDDPDGGMLTNFLNTLRRAHKFNLTDDFINTPLAQMASESSLEKSFEWFRLPHDPMWMEWHEHITLQNKANAYQQESHGRFGMLMHKAPLDPAAMMVWCVGSLNNDVLYITAADIYPDTLTLKDGKITIRALFHGADADGNKVIEDTEDEGKSITINVWMQRQIYSAVDYVIRLNSPSVTDIAEPADMSRLNKKRLRSGKPPMQEMRVVDLAKHVKAALKQAGTESDEEAGHVRYHWRRGHFKARKTGIFWWNPHTAGRKELGEITKEYVA